MKRDCGLRFGDCDLGGKLSLGPVADADAHALTLTKLSDAVAPESLHVHEDVGCIGTARDKAVALAAVEPLYGGVEAWPTRLGQIALRAIQSCRLRRRRRVVEDDQAPGLEAFGALDSLADDPRAFIGSLEAGLANTSLMQQDVAAGAVGGLYKSVALGKVEPFDETADFDCRLPLNWAKP